MTSPQLERLLGFLALYAISGVGAVIVLSFCWGCLRLFMMGPAANAVRLLSSRIAGCMHRRETLDSALIGLRVLFSWPLSRRLGAACADLHAGDRPSLVGVLDERKLLPRVLVPLGRAAERLGPNVLESWFRSLSLVPGPRDSFTRRTTTALVTILIFFKITFFLGVFIAPKMDYIFRELAVPLPIGWSFCLSFTEVVQSWIDLPTILLIVTVPIAWWTRLRWRLERRHLRAEIILNAVKSGSSEDAIAAALDLPVANGSLASLCHAAGWQVDDADALALALAASRERRARRKIVAGTVMEIVSPIVLALPVLFLALTVFQGFIRILDALEATTW